MTVKNVRSLFPVREKMWVENVSTTGNRCPVRDKISVEYPVPNGTMRSRCTYFSTHIMSLTGQFRNEKIFKNPKIFDTPPDGCVAGSLKLLQYGNPFFDWRMRGE